MRSKQQTEQQTVQPTRCMRCHGKASKQWHTVHGFTVGVECVPAVEQAAATGLRGPELEGTVRDAYVAMMRTTTTTGMVLKGMLDLRSMLQKGKLTEDSFLAAVRQHREWKYREAYAQQLLDAAKQG